MNPQTLTPKHTNPPVVGGSPRDGRHLIRPPATESTLKQRGPAPIPLPGVEGFDLGSNTRISAISTPNRTTVWATAGPCLPATNPGLDGFTKASTEPALLPCWLGLQSLVRFSAQLGSACRHKTAHIDKKRRAREEHGSVGCLNNQGCVCVALGLASRPGRAGWGREPALEETLLCQAASLCSLVARVRWSVSMSLKTSSDNRRRSARYASRLVLPAARRRWKYS